MALVEHLAMDSPRKWIERYIYAKVLVCRTVQKGT
jgi:hypothetical protein